MSKTIEVVIMAGGSGTRFWPYSTPTCPKQFLDLTGEGTMIQLTVKRLMKLVDVASIWVLTNGSFVDTVLEQCPELEPSQVIGEPMMRDTSAAVALGAGLVKAKNPDALMAVLPADHVIRDVDGFCGTLKEAGALAEAGHVVTIGVEPTYPAEIYGYLKTGEAIDGGYRLERFVEKPCREDAEAYFGEGGYFWNAGMFIWSVARISEELERHLPEHAAMAKALGEAYGQSNWDDLARERFEPLEKISIDFGLMEKLDSIAMVKSNFDWNDVGGWLALEDLIEADGEGNVLQGANVLKDSSGNIVITQSEERPTLVVGIRDSVIINGASGVLVCHKSEIERIKSSIEKVLGI